jgi:hypothetical protein
VLGAALLAELLAMLVLKIWKANLDVPFAYSWDANMFAMYTKEILHGSYYRNGNLGAPFGQQLYDYPNIATDLLQAVLIKLLGVFSSDWAVVTNIYFLLTFPLAAAAAYLAFRRLGATPAPSVVCATLFALLPYHFVRGETHLFYSGYFAVPIGAYLALAVFMGEPLFVRRSRAAGRGLLAYASSRSLLVIALCAVVALASGAGYYALFTVLLVAAGILAAALAGRGKAALATGAVVIAVIGVVTIVNLSPSLAYAARHGSNDVAGQRSWKESEFQALKLTQLVLPIEQHRIGALARVSQKYLAFQRSLGQPGQPPLVQRFDESETVHLGFVATLGFASLLLVALAAIAGAATRRLPPAVVYASAAALVCFLIGTVGGISALIAGTITPQFRSWNRISLFIAFFALLAVALVLSGVERRWAVTGLRRASLGLVLAGILAVGVLDQTSAANVPAYRSIAESYRSDGQFVRRIEQRIGADGSVFQLPYMPFPDGGVVHRMTDYDLVRGYLHSDGLHWSFGAMSGRPEDWQAELARRPLELQVDAAASAGFDGVYVDRFGYADSARSLERRLRELTGEPPITSADNRLFFFDLRGLRRRLERGHTTSALGGLRRATLEPLTVGWSGFGDAQGRAGREWRPFASNAALVVTNPSRSTRRALFEAVIAGRDEAGREVTLRYPDGSSGRVRPSRSGSRITHVLELAPGTNVIGLEVGASRTVGDAAPLRAQARVLDEGFWPFAGPTAANRRSG